jgi:hypothetical protein
LRPNVHKFFEKAPDLATDLCLLAVNLDQLEFEPDHLDRCKNQVEKEIKSDRKETEEHEKEDKIIEKNWGKHNFIKNVTLKEMVSGNFKDLGPGS